jgi:hypothetical protein
MVFSLEVLDPMPELEYGLFMLLIFSPYFVLYIVSKVPFHFYLLTS